MASSGRPYRTLRIHGFDVLVGRGSEENDVLTFEVAEPHEIWMHVGGDTPGSHVVVRNPSRAVVPKEVLEGAAAAAAWYSKARGAARVEVEYCAVSAVSKPRGAPAGLVELASSRTIKVRPAVPSAE